MKGLILCNKCRKKMDGVCKCTEKGNAKCIIKIYWKGKNYEYRRDDKGFIYTYETALSRLTNIANEIRKGTFNPVEFSDTRIKERKFENKIEKWLQEKEKELQRGVIRPSSYGNINGYISNYFTFFHGMDVREIKLEQLSDFYDSLPSTLKLKTKKNIFNALHSFFVWLWKRGVRDIPPFPNMEGDDDSKERVALDYEDQQELLKKIPEIHRDIIEFGMETGLRVGELIVLKIGDIDFKNGSLWVRRTVSAYVNIVESTKGRHKDKIPLSNRALELCIKNVQGKEKWDFLFIRPDTGKRYSVKAPNAIWKKYTGLNDVTYYEASRHSFATQMVDSGVDSLQTKELMRHTDVRTTQRYYHGSTTRLRDIVNRRGQVLSLVKGTGTDAE
ncbi:MAG: tyrosine-type recombinase/integrase [Syntrophorhabdaceae bacterium]|nr:tyrosine-type recombinase/integrase [Syntrophorhabdaceae bacterium]MDD5243949.1 tyrosine-type recombinase/integrase [Syntrophorhabdaceae bacterium]